MACACGCCRQHLGSPCGCEWIRLRIARWVRRPILPVGELRGLIYRRRRWPGEAPKTYVHFFKRRLPHLAADPSGTRLYIVGGQYRFTHRGIEG